MGDWPFLGRIFFYRTCQLFVYEVFDCDTESLKITIFKLLFQNGKGEGVTKSDHIGLHEMTDDAYSRCRAAHVCDAKPN